MPVDYLAKAGAYARKADACREKRDEFIRKAYAEGHTLRAIAEAVGLSSPGVLGIVRRED